MADVSMKKVYKRFEDIEIIHGVDLEVTHKELVVFVGPSGCGKTTLLRLIAGLENITEGDLYIGDQRCNDLQSADRRIAMVFQSYALYPHMTVAENMSFGLRMARRPKDEINEKVDRAARILQLENHLERKPKQLSGGQRQRVAIGRAIVRAPEVFLFDEPLSNLDAELRVEMRVQLQELHDQLGTTMIYVTHDQVEAMTMADKIVVLNDGHIEQVGSPLELYERPQNPFVAGFIGSPKMNLFHAPVEAVEDGAATLALPDSDARVSIDRGLASAVSVGSHVQLGIRPEHLSESGTGDNVIQLPVDVLERMGNAAFIYGNYGGLERFVVETDAHSDAKPGDTVSVSFNTADCYVFDEQGTAYFAQ